jgi:hypothetical protein
MYVPVLPGSLLEFIRKVTRVPLHPVSHECIQSTYRRYYLRFYCTYEVLRTRSTTTRTITVLLLVVHHVVPALDAWHQYLLVLRCALLELLFDSA